MTRTFSVKGGRGAVVLRELAADLAALVWPVECAGCGAANRACCDRCQEGLLAAALAAVRGAEGAADGDPPGGLSTRPSGRASRHPPHFCAGPHDGLLRDLLVPFKHVGRTSLAPILGEVLAVPLAHALTLVRGPAPPFIVPIPSRPDRVRERGFHHVELLARAALRSIRRGSPRSELGTPPSTHAQAGTPRWPERAPPEVLRALRPLPGRTGQVGLRAEARRRNAARIAVRSRSRRRLIAREVILLDDVRTTGETLAAAAVVLNRVGAKVVAVVTLAQAQRHAPR